MWLLCNPQHKRHRAGNLQLTQNSVNKRYGPKSSAKLPLFEADGIDCIR